MVSCEFHPDRPGVGVCMRCRAVICAACCTRVDDVNHCHACLKELAARPVRTAGSSTAQAVLALAVACLFFFGVFWAARGSLAP
jgi:hypothetical protein